jgi:hypothetical protein
MKEIVYGITTLPGFNRKDRKRYNPTFVGMTDKIEIVTFPWVTMIEKNRDDLAITRLIEKIE